MAFKHPDRIVNIDMDNTAFDFEDPIKVLLARRGIDYADPTKDFYIAKRYDDPQTIALIESAQNSKGFFSGLPLIPGFQEAWDAMQEAGYSPRFNTKPLRSNPYCIEEKKEAIDAHFGPQAVDEAYIGSNKEDEPGIALFDDRPGLTNGRTWQRVIYTQPCNQHESGPRLTTWHDPNLFPILAQCASRYDHLMKS